MYEVHSGSCCHFFCVSASVSGEAPQSVCLPEDRDESAKRPEALLRPLPSDYLRHLPCNAEILPLLPLVISSLLVQGTPAPPTMFILLIIFIFFFLYKICGLVSVTIALGFVGSTLIFFCLTINFFGFCFTSCLLIFLGLLMCVSLYIIITIFAFFSHSESI